MNIVIRPIKIGDYKDISNFLFPRSGIEDVKRQVASDLKLMKEEKLMRCVAEIDGKVVGQAAFQKFDSPIRTHLVEIVAMVVNTEYQGKGISSKLMEFGLRWAKQYGAEKALLSVRKGDKAEKIYAHQGFRAYGELKEGIKESWGNKIVYYDEVLMYKYLKDSL